MQQPKDSKLSMELKVVMQHYVDYMKNARKMNNNINEKFVSIKYDFNLYQSLVPHSCLADELVEKFVKVPFLMFTKEDGYEIKSYTKDVNK